MSINFPRRPLAALLAALPAAATSTPTGAQQHHDDPIPGDAAARVAPVGPPCGGIPFPDIGPHVLEYVEDSAELQTLEWDGGNSELDFADLNLDGHVDLVTVGDHGSPFINTDMHGITVWFGDGAGGWSLFQSGNFGYGGLAVGDVNLDGLPDVAYGVHHNYSSSDLGDQLLEVALGDGSGRAWTPWDDDLATEGQSWGMFGTELADVDADGFLDVASNSFGCCDGFHVYRNDADGSWTRLFGVSGGNSGTHLATGDVNSDGFPDFAAARQDATVWLNDGAGSFTSGDANLPGRGGRYHNGPSLGDLNRDGFDDLAYASTAGGVEVFLQDPDSTQWIDAVANLPDSGPFEATRLADMDADGDLDLVAFGERRLAVWLGDGEGGPWTLAATWLVPNPGYHAALAVGDVDHNGYPDVAILSEQGSIFNSVNTLQLFREASEPRCYRIVATGPTRYRTLRQGAATFIDWLAAVPTGDDASQTRVDVEISYDGPHGPWEPLAMDNPNSGRCQIAVPTDHDPGEAHLRLTLKAAGDAKAVIIVGPLSMLP